jgi:ribosomal protein S18 acetylase RimI-like enzyme
MTDDEFVTYRDRLVREYAQEHVLAGNWTAEEAEAKSAAQVDELLPEGLATPGTLLRIAETAAGDGAGRRVGLLWLALHQLPDGTPGQAWIYDIEVDADQRGQGYGRALLAEAEEELRRHGAPAVGLNVFGRNEVALGLYASSGYQVTSQQMRKELG